MGKGKRMGSKEDKMRPALTPEGREKQLMALAMDAAEEKLKDRTASSQIICAFIKAGSEKEKMEKDILKKQIELMDAKIEALRAAQKAEGMYVEALEAFRRYSGQNRENEYQDLH